MADQGAKHIDGHCESARYVLDTLERNSADVDKIIHGKRAQGK